MGERLFGLAGHLGSFDELLQARSGSPPPAHNCSGKLVQGHQAEWAARKVAIGRQEMVTGSRMDGLEPGPDLGLRFQGSDSVRLGSREKP